MSTNLLAETIDALERAGQRTVDVDYVLYAGASMRCTWDRFERVTRDLDYQSFTGLDDDLLIVGKELHGETWWLERKWNGEKQSWAYHEGALNLHVDDCEEDAFGPTPSQLRTSDR
jgi:hypothetical protein